MLADNIAEGRANLLDIFAEYLALKPSDDAYRAAIHVLQVNLVHGDALTLRTNDDRAITFAEWGYLGKGRFQRRDLRYYNLTQMSALAAEGSLFAGVPKQEIFRPIKTYPPVRASSTSSTLTSSSPRRVGATTRSSSTRTTCRSGSTSYVVPTRRGQRAGLLRRHLEPAPARQARSGRASTSC